MRTIVTILALALTFMPASFASAESLSNFPMQLGSNCQRASHGDIGEFFVYYFHTGFGSMAKISTTDDKTYKVEMDAGSNSFPNRQAALKHVKATLCNH